MIPNKLQFLQQNVDSYQILRIVAKMIEQKIIISSVELHQNILLFINYHIKIIQLVKYENYIAP